MEKAELKGLFVKGNMPVGADYKAALGDVLEAFPYFQLAQMFYAKQMYDAHEPGASGRIKLASVYAPDRKAMYLLFKKPTQNAEEKKVEKAITAKPDKGDVKYNFVYSSSTAENTTVTNVPPKKEAESPSLSESFIRKEVEAKQSSQVQVEKPTQKLEIKKAEVKKVETPIVSEKKTYSSPVLEKKDTKEAPPKETIVPIKIETPLVEKKEVDLGVIASTNIEKANEVVNEPITDSNLKYSFSSWLKVMPEISIEKKQETKPITQEKRADIIDNFLKKAPSISRPKAEFFSPVKAAKLSITEDDTIVSETLAKIYIVQGNYQKAIKAYQTLLLQFPEKKNIFAPRIEEIKALIRENTKPGTK